MTELTRCDLHVHSRFSTDSGNYALRRARLGESYTEPERVYRVCKRRGMRFVTITDHNTVEGALRIAGHPDAFVSVEVTTRFPEDDVPLHALVWDLTEEDHRDLQPYRSSVYELTAFLRDRRLVHALAHPLYRMGPPLTASHVERMMLLFSIWEGRNGARPEEANTLACRLARAATPEYVTKLAERHGLEPAHAGHIALTGGSDDHGALDIATTFTEAPGESIELFLAAIATGLGAPRGAHGSTVKLAHAVAALAASLRDFARQLASGSYPREILGSILAAGRAPRAAVRLARSVHALDLGRELKALRARGVRVTVVGCASDTLTTPMHCRRVAALAGADYRELSVAGGHMWMLHHPEEFALLF
jgi:hypothetical protein